jgi:hypothetical protein
MAGMIDRDEFTRGRLMAGVEPPACLDECLVDSEQCQHGSCVFRPSPQGMVPVLCWIDTLYGQPFPDADVAPEAWSLYVAQQASPDELQYALDVQRLHEQGDDQMSMYDRMSDEELEAAYEVANRARESLGVAPAVLYHDNEQAMKGCEEHGRIG